MKIRIPDAPRLGLPSFFFKVPLKKDMCDYLYKLITKYDLLSDERLEMMGICEEITTIFAKHNVDLMRK